MQGNNLNLYSAVKDPVSLPETPGVYLFRDQSGRVIYVGKAKNIKKRVLSYFRPASDFPAKTATMMSKAKTLDYILTGSENEAFILESNLIKSHLPRYNVVLRDDKQYPCLRLDIKEPYPRLSIVRRIKRDGALYFGPFSSSQSVRNTLKLIDRVFRLRKCRSIRLVKRSRPCLNYQLGRCLAPCANDVPVVSYRKIVDKVRLFLEGRSRELLGRLKKDMKRFSDQQAFEDAARVRDQIRAVEKTIERQDVVSQRMDDQDVIGLARDDAIFHVVILFVRKGCLIGSRDYLFRDKGASDSEIIEAFLKQYYHDEPFIPVEILIPVSVDDVESIKAWLSDLAGKKISIHRPLKGKKVRLVNMAVSNAESLLTRKGKPQQEDLMELARSLLRLRRTPRHIEGLDISNLQGTLSVGTAVSFREGLPFKSGYRNYRMVDPEGIDDYGKMSELVRRRFSSGNLPDLLVVDGGKGHLSAVKRVVDSFPGKTMPEVVSIAKAGEKGPHRTDKVYIIGRKNPLRLNKDNPVLLLLMRIRDEAHRRAVTYHRRLRHDGVKASRLDLIPGIGPKRKRLLLKFFGNVDAIFRASPQDLALVPGISRSLARDISISLMDETVKKRGERTDNS
jgi:excinuclease ABC subunit C